jgi:hypothetical protein
MPTEMSYFMLPFACLCCVFFIFLLCFSVSDTPVDVFLGIRSSSK